MNTRKDQLRAFERLLDIMDELREKCPWDRKQTMETLRALSIEEIYELSDAIIEKDSDEIKKELVVSLLSESEFKIKEIKFTLISIDDTKYYLSLGEG